MKIIEIIIDAQGQTTIKTQGFTGASCMEATRFLEKSLGQKLSEQHTAEFHQEQPQQTHLESHS